MVIRKSTYYAVAALVSLGFGVVLSLAQTGTISVDISKAKLYWTWTQGSGGPVEKWLVRCGPTSGNYTTQTEIQTPTARSVPISAIVANNGTYFCIVQAANAFGSGGASPEVTFQAGRTPDQVQTLTVGAQ